MKKVFLKKSYIRETIQLYIIRFILCALKFKYKKQDKILIKSVDGIGDILLRSELSNRIIKKYGQKKIYFLMKKEFCQLGDQLGYQTIPYEKKHAKSFFFKLIKMYQLNKIGIKKYINLEYGPDITLAHILSKETIGIKSMKQMNKRYNKFYTKSDYTLPIDYEEKGTILNLIKIHYTMIFNQDITNEELCPCLDSKVKEIKDNIVIQVGASTKERVLSPLTMVLYIKEILKITPEKKIILLGYGEEQKKYAKRLEEKLKDIRLINQVNKTTLKESFELIASSSLYIGFDSGLYNYAFSIKKNIIVFFRKKGWYAHDYENIKILYPDSKKIITNDKEYNNEDINRISINKFVQAYQEINRVGK